MSIKQHSLIKNVRTSHNLLISITAIINEMTTKNFKKVFYLLILIKYLFKIFSSYVDDDSGKLYMFSSANRHKIRLLKIFDIDK